VSSLPLSLTAALRTALERVLGRQQAALAEIVALALTGTRSHGHDAERALVDAREALDRVLSGPVRDLAGEPEPAKLGAAAYVSLQLLSALDGLLRQTERMTDARIASVGAVSDVSALPWDDEPVLRSLHRLISEGLAAAHASVLRREPVDLDAARTREIEI